MNGYMEMLLEYKQTEALLRKRIGELSEKMKTQPPNIERELLAKRKSTLEQELYDLLDVMDKLYEYCGVRELCRNA